MLNVKLGLAPLILGKEIAPLDNLTFNIKHLTLKHKG